MGLLTRGSTFSPLEKLQPHVVVMPGSSQPEGDS